jgi:TonB family protein
MNAVRGFLASIALSTLSVSCATEAPPPAPAPAALPEPPANLLRVFGTATCMWEVGCAACSDDNDKNSVRMAPFIYSTQLRGCYDRGAKTTHAGAEPRILIRIGIDPTGHVGASCVVRSSLNDKSIESCLADVAQTWKFSPPKSGGWALVDQTFVVPR